MNEIAYAPPTDEQKARFPALLAVNSDNTAQSYQDALKTSLKRFEAFGEQNDPIYLVRRTKFSPKFFGNAYHCLVRAYACADARALFVFICIYLFIYLKFLFKRIK